MLRKRERACLPSRLRSQRPNQHLCNTLDACHNAAVLSPASTLPLLPVACRLCLLASCSLSFSVEALAAQEAPWPPRRPREPPPPLPRGRRRCDNARSAPHGVRPVHGLLAHARPSPARPGQLQRWSRGLQNLLSMHPPHYVHMSIESFGIECLLIVEDVLPVATTASAGIRMALAHRPHGAFLHLSWWIAALSSGRDRAHAAVGLLAMAPGVGRREPTRDALHAQP